MRITLLAALAVTASVMLAAQVTREAAPTPQPFAAAPSWAETLRQGRARLPAKPAPGDWLAEHPESGQTVQAYQRSKPIRPDATWKRLYVQPLGDFTPAERAVLEKTVAYMQAFFCLPVNVLPGRPTADFPASARRQSAWGPQLLTTHILYSVLMPDRPADAVAVLGLTATDLWPGDGWNFVYGQASLRHRVGVWSMARNGDLKKAPELFLQRTLKIAVHETGHMLGIEHCTAWACVMNGVNNQAEADRAPLSLCPEDMLKLTWNTGCDPLDRIRRLKALADEWGLPARSEFAAMTEQLERAR